MSAEKEPELSLSVREYVTPVIYTGSIVVAGGAAMAVYNMGDAFGKNPDASGLDRAVGQLESSLKTCEDPVDRVYDLTAELAILSSSPKGNMAHHTLQSHDNVLYGLPEFAGNMELSSAQCQAVSTMVNPALEDARFLVNNYNSMRGEAQFGVGAGVLFALAGVGIATYFHRQAKKD